MSATCALNHVITYSCTSSSLLNFLQRIHSTTSSHFANSLCYHKQQQFVCEFPLDIHLLHWEIIWQKHLAFGGTLDRRCHFKHVSLKQSRFSHCQTSTAHSQRIKVDSNVAIISIKNFPIGLHVMYLYFPDTPRSSPSCTYIYYPL